MPEVSRFLGIIIRFYYNEHLPAHFHAEYGEHQAQIAIGSHALLRGGLPGRVLGLVQEWAELHGAELQHCWEQARRGEIPDKIAPLV
jgi:hypothetical protein